MTVLARFPNKIRVSLALDFLALGFIVFTVSVLGRSSFSLYKKSSHSIDYQQILAVENLTVDATSAGLEYNRQDTTSFGDVNWSNNNQLLVLASAQDSWIRFKLAVEAGQKTLLTAFFTQSYDYGIVQISIDGRGVGKPIDLWADNVAPTGPIAIGEFIPAKSIALIEFRVVGKNQGSRHPFYQFGIDGIKLEKVTP